jgi:tetratricopeptide (TPR) repeat protein
MTTTCTYDQYPRPASHPITEDPPMKASVLRSAGHGRRLLNMTALLALAWLGAGQSWAQTGEAACGNPFKSFFGPWDYRSASAANKKTVEQVHYTIGIEMLTKSSTTTMREMAADVAYTLTVFPNHHRALITMTRLAEKYRSDPAPGTNLPVECFFDRAIRFRPDDTVARALYAQFLDKQKRKADALEQMAIAVGHAKDSALSHLNLGKLYFDMGEYELALKQAHQAQQMGHPAKDLEAQLQGVGKWVERNTQ